MSTDIGSNNYYYLCRLCALKYCEIGYLIFSDDGVIRNISKKIQDCLHLMVTQQDTFPKTLCNSCYYKLEEFYDFQLKCLEAQHYLANFCKNDLSVSDSLEVFNNQEFPCLDMNILNDNSAIQDLQNLVNEARLNEEHNDISRIIQYHDNELNEEQIREINQLDVEKLRESSILNKDTDSLPDIGLYTTFAISEVEDANNFLNNSTFEIDDIKIPPQIETNNTNSNVNQYVDNSLNVQKETNTKTQVKQKSGPKKCDICQKEFRTNYKLNEHKRVHSKETPFKCSVATCEKKFRSKIGLIQHEARHTGQYTYFCEICGKGFQIKSYLTIHQKVHSDIKAYKCDICGLSFKAKQGLIDHENRHLGLKKFQCNKCEQKFITKALCASHEKTHSNISNRQYHCLICNNSYVSKQYLKTHMLAHSGIKPFICKYCGKSFVTDMDLRRHETSHTKAANYICELCGKSFGNKFPLVLHMRTHTGKKPYKCKFCQQSFTQCSTLKIHVRLHTGEKPYTCQTCLKTFISRTVLRNHISRHHEIKTQNLDDEFYDIMEDIIIE